MDIKAGLREILGKQGFELVGFARVEAPMHLKTYLNWIASGKHAGMAYLASERAAQRRSDPTLVMPEARSIVVVGLRYDNPQNVPTSGGARVAAYAVGSDYHEIIPPRLEQAARQIQEELGYAVAWRSYTDTGPILERDYAMAAGLGWIGKNTCLISPTMGSYFLLGELFLDIEVEPDQPFLADYCGSCRRCIEACPTDCIGEDRTLDSARCISYLTIENKAEIPGDLRPLVGDWLFGCDICQQVCPWNVRFASMTGDPALSAVKEQPDAPLSEELRLTPQEFNRKFKNRPILRAKRRGYLRNAAVVLGNQQDEAAIPALRECLLYETEALVRVHAAWALGRFANQQAHEALELALKTETDAMVSTEITAALAKIP